MAIKIYKEEDELLTPVDLTPMKELIDFDDPENSEYRYIREYEITDKIQQAIEDTPFMEIAEEALSRSTSAKQMAEKATEDVTTAIIASEEAVEKVDELNTKVDSYDARVSRVEETAAAAATLAGEADDLVKSILEDVLPPMQESIDTNKEDISNLKTKSTRLEKDLNDTKSSLETTRSNLAQTINNLNTFKQDQHTIDESQNNVIDELERELSTKADKDELDSKQDTLESGTNIKTINGESILGPGNIVVQGGEGGDVYTDRENVFGPDQYFEHDIYIRDGRNDNIAKIGDYLVTGYEGEVKIQKTSTSISAQNCKLELNDAGVYVTTRNEDYDVVQIYIGDYVKSVISVTDDNEAFYQDAVYPAQHHKIVYGQELPYYLTYIFINVPKSSNLQSWVQTSEMPVDNDYTSMQEVPSDMTCLKSTNHSHSSNYRFTINTNTMLHIYQSSEEYYDMVKVNGNSIGFDNMMNIWIPYVANAGDVISFVKDGSGSRYADTAWVYFDSTVSYTPEYFMPEQQLIYTKAQHIDGLVDGKGFLKDAPSDGNQYVRKSGNWSVLQESIPEAPVDGQIYARQDAGWVSLGGDEYVPVAISDVESLINAMNGYNNTPGGLKKRYYYLENDIDCGEQTLPGFGTHDKTGLYFTNNCVFDGRLHTISNFKIESNSESVGFFNNIADAEVMNLYVEDFTIQGYRYVGFIGNQDKGSTSIHHISFRNGTITATDQNASCITGLYMTYKSSIKNIYIENVSIKGGREAAIITGWKGDGGSVIDNIAIAKTDITGSEYGRPFYRGSSYGADMHIHWDKYKDIYSSTPYTEFTEDDLTDGTLVDLLNQRTEQNDWVQGDEHPVFNTTILKDIPISTNVYTDQVNKFKEDNYFAKNIYEGGIKLEEKYALKDELDTKADKSELDNKQDTLESGVNIATINSQSLLDGGNIEIESGIPDAPDGYKVYGRKFNEWLEVTPEAPADDKVYGRKNEEWVEVATKEDIAPQTPNVVKFGDLEIENGVMRNFSASNYAQFPFLMDLTNKAFEITMEITTGNDVSNQQNILDSRDGLAFAIRSGQFVLAVSNNGTSWAFEATGGTVEANTTYLIKLSWNRLVYSVKYSTNNAESWSEAINQPFAGHPYPRTMIIGKDETGRYYFRGQINLNKCTLSVNNQYVWDGMTDAGLLTRLETDLGNIDTAGVAKIKEIVAQDTITLTATLEDGSIKTFEIYGKEL